MPVYIHPANLIIPKEIIAKKYKGGIEQFLIDYGNENVSFQEDLELVSLARLNCDEFPEFEIVEKGLEYDSVNQRSDDYVIVSRYGGPLWEVDWLESGAVYAFHVDCSLNHKAMAYQVEKMKMDEIDRIAEAGGEPFKTIK